MIIGRWLKLLWMAALASTCLNSCINLPVPTVPTPLLPTEGPIAPTLRPTRTLTVSRTPAGTDTPEPTATATPQAKATRSPEAPIQTPTSGGDPVLVGAGDITRCSTKGDQITAQLLENIPGTIFTAGDSENDEGSPEEYAECFAPYWGKMLSRIRPALGNHDYLTQEAAGFFGYFSSMASETQTGYYSYDLGAWHIVVLNSNCSKVGGCDEGSPELEWLRADLAAHPVQCTLAYWHHPRFSSGKHGSDPHMQPFWQVLFEYGTEVVVNGHNHDYERFAPQDPEGNSDPVNGIREFVAGTGGASHDPFPEPALPNTEIRNDVTFGVLKFTLHPMSYDWEFIPEPGKKFTDNGSTACH